MGIKLINCGKIEDKPGSSSTAALVEIDVSPVKKLHDAFNPASLD